MENNTPALPIEHISYSALSLFCSNQQRFLKGYILGIWDEKTSPSAVVGKAFHSCMEEYLTSKKWDNGINAGIAYINTVKDADIDYGKLGSRENILADYHKVCQFFKMEEPYLGEGLAVELKITTDMGFDGNPLPLPVKAISDYVTRTEEGIAITDWKVVTSFTDKDEDQPDYIMQSVFNYMTVRAQFNEDPRKMRFVEIKKSKNKDNSPQIQIYEIDYMKHPEYFKYFSRIYGGFIRTIVNPNHIYLPNFRDKFTGQEAWRDFAAETMDFVVPPKVSHKSVLQRTIRDVKYVESFGDMVEGKNLTTEERIQAKLQEFGIPVKMEETHAGHNVTLYTMKPSRGVKMSAIAALENDVAIALHAKSVRIKAPIPGTGLVGVEVSNEVQQKIDWSDNLIEENTLRLPVGVDVYGKNYSLDLAKAPHLLIAGTTGSGKSVALNVFIRTLLAQNMPDKLGLILIDPKRTEFVEHENSAHLETGIITEADEACSALLWAAKEMETRYKLLRSQKVKTIDEYISRGNSMKKLVIVIDELADLMLSTELSDEIENSLVRLAQKSRAVGIHLILATQRPSTDVITGILKANFPTRIGFMTATQVDSKVVLDQGGCEKLMGNGDLLMMLPAEKDLIRLQGYYL